jgi:UDP-4-amino-4-deoxy-L-arabinose formyltransferase/UDP-glucuronic acid dehydrogenase (UDP-4-keto-hexauronic acid decarboxylating)
VNILLVGEESAGAQTLKLLANSAHRLVGVMASPARKLAGGMTVWQHAEKMGFRTWPAEFVKDSSFAEVIREVKVDLLLNVHSLFVIKPEIVKAPRFGSFNLHPGPLPRYAGLNAPSWAIYRGEKSHGVTLHKMHAGIDTGEISYQAMFAIEDSDNGFSVSAKCIKLGLELIKQLLDAAEQNPGSIPMIKQDLTQREYFGKGTPEDGVLAWSRPAREIYNFIRAADYSPFTSPWKHPSSIFEGREIAFIKSHLTGIACNEPAGTIGESDGGKVFIACQDEWLSVGRIIVGGKYLDAAAALKQGGRLGWKSEQ